MGKFTTNVWPTLRYLRERWIKQNRVHKWSIPESRNNRQSKRQRSVEGFEGAVEWSECVKNNTRAPGTSSPWSCIQIDKTEHSDFSVLFPGIGLSKWKKMKALAAQLCLTLCDPMDYSPLGSSIHGIHQARILEWIAITFSRGSSWPRVHTAGRFFTVWATREAQLV